MSKFVNKYLSNLEDFDLQILDIGSQDINGTYRPFFDKPNWQYKGLDIAPGSNVDIVIEDYYAWNNLNNNSFDVVISGQAFEHIEYVWLTIQEIARVTKPGGFICIIAPSSGPEHKYPLDCWRILPDGMKALAKSANLEVLESYISLDEAYKGEPNVWKDTTLICQK